MTQSNDVNRRLERLESDNMDIRLAVSALLETVSLHQANFADSQRRFEENDRRFDQIFTQMQEMQSEIRGLQLENRRMLDRLLGQQSDETE